MNVLIIFLVLVGTCLGTKVRYDGYQVYRLTPKSQDAVDFLRSLEDSYGGYDFWSSVKGVGYPVDIMVPPHFLNVFNTTVNSGKFDSEIFVPDVQKLIDNEQPKLKARGSRALSWDAYPTLDEINQFLQNLANENSNVVSVVTVGRSYEGRDILGVKISFSPVNEDRTVFIESNIHAREWITSAVTTWMLNEMLLSTDSEVIRIVRSHDWIVVPVFNPDGFVYTQEDRMWRKTRTPYFFCYGADPNRNWGYHFNDGGSSSNPCSNTYRGSHAFSEESTKTISEYITSVGTSLRAYIAIHSYSQLLLLPYGFSNEPLDNYDDLYTVGLQAAEKLKERYNTEYRVGNIVDMLYVASGGSMDWVKGTFNTPITYTYELRDKGEHGFVLPAEQIIPTAEETFDSLLAILDGFDKLEGY